ncbi:MAG: aldolase [Nitrospina sp.]|jgi:fructose/tagatose bisphosphate aldolase|nr:aldolase [Nitrospina sp.]MBT3414066.1 aldolase [Nitrospina sp.]MBT3857338.1 aldolase [Nitrospina sp.]MBT4388948.1 aldolase [Nitrospina sp.]MBT4620341.1 aldolase [Nitrospina sp.]
MLFNHRDEVTNQLKNIATQDNGGVKIEDADKLRGDVLDQLVQNAVLNPSAEIKGLSRFLIKSAALELGIVNSSIQGLYDARGRGEVKGFTVPALNIRGMPYELCRAIFRTAIKSNAGAFIFELAKSEMSYTFQEPTELSTVILAAAIKEGFTGPVFIQGDHFQVNVKNYAQDPKKEIAGLKNLIQRGISGGFYNIDIDTSTLVDLSKPNVVEQQRANFEVGVELTQYIRELEPDGVTISVGGEIGEVGKENSNEQELRAYLDNFNELLEKNRSGATTISKISIQTGTSHGGVPLPDGSVAEVNLDFDTLENLSRISREDYGLAGAVQHGASTLPQDLFHKFAELETAEIHLATDFQNMIYGSTLFPADFKEEIYTHLREKFVGEKKSDQTDEQFIYKTRKKGFGEFKSRFWGLSNEIREGIGKELETKMDFLFDKLAVQNTKDAVNKTVEQVPIQPNLENEISASS